MPPSTFPVLAWVEAHTAFGVVTTVVDKPVFSLGRQTAPVAANLVLLAAGIATILGLTGKRNRCRWLGIGAGLAAVSGFGVLMDLATLVFDQQVDDPVTAINHALGMIGVAVLVPRLVAGRRERVRVVAAVGIGALLPCMAVKVT
jgi:hypothetical protein